MRRRTVLAFPLIRVAGGSTQAAMGDVNLLFDGDSISAGLGASPGQGLDARVAAGIGDHVRLRNVAVSGRPVSTCLRLYPNLAAPLFMPDSRCNVIVFHAGDNDILQGRTAEQTYAAFTAYVAAAHQQGWKIVVSTELPRPDFSPEQEAELRDYNKLLRANSNGVDEVVDFSSDPRMVDLDCRKDPRLFSHDGIHPSDGGYAVLAGMLTAAVQRTVER